MKNDNRLISLLTSLDISENEAVTYNALLQMESTSIRKIAAYTGVNRGTTYDALKKLVAGGLVSVKNQGKREQYTAESPEKIFDIIREKRRDLLDATTSAKNIVPDLLARTTPSESGPLVRYYENGEGIAAILKDVLQTCRTLPVTEYYAYSSPVRQYLYQEYPQFTERRIKEGIKVKVIAVGEGGEEAEMSERRWLPHPPKVNVTSYTIIYGPKVAVISMSDDLTLYGVIIEDAGATALQRLAFEHIWDTL
jgi:sugar-specific transcriptional regulator TrmB